MYYQVYPNITKEADYVVLASGLGGHASFWQPQIQALQAYFHVVVYDQEGCHADSAALPKDYSFFNLAEQLEQLLCHLQIKRFHFIGHALGGFIGVEWAYRFAQTSAQMLSLSLINAWQSLDAHTRRCFTTRRTLLEQAGAEAYLHAQALFLYPPTWISSHSAMLIEQEAKLQQDFPPHGNVLARLNALMHYVLDKPRCAALDSLPILLLCNQDDMLVPYTQSLQLYRALGHAELVILPQGGHACTVTQAGQVNTCLIEFLNQTDNAQLKSA
ncbi:pyrimidine utilization protein D [Acinetobacter soli]|uniref:pyrimidine utilization protein D n=1 Tax=Acinetobacter soli TaxID=487316 RepID=UPI000468587E|nr:pyrimidine utilization protein D [Acinetobacter soli]MEB4800953.1 pyrimidine utilization protein D [Acinetobacter soli]